MPALYRERERERERERKARARLSEGVVAHQQNFLTIFPLDPAAWKYPIHEGSGYIGRQLWASVIAAVLVYLPTGLLVLVTLNPGTPKSSLRPEI